MLSEPKFHHVVVKLQAFDTGAKHTQGTVQLDDLTLKGVREVIIKGGFKQVTEVTLTFIASIDVEIDNPEVTVGEDS